MNVKQFYQDINGSYEKALSIMMNDALISRLLAKFMANNSFDEIVASFDKKDYRALFTAAHAFKGVTGNLALTPLYEISCALSEATRNDDSPDVGKEIQQLKDAYALVKASYEKNL